MVNQPMRPETTAKRDVWVILDERKKPVARYMSPTREKAIDAFCYPALRKEAYFFDGGWSCEKETASQ